MAQTDQHSLQRGFWFGQTGTRSLSLFRILFSLLLLRDAIYHLFLIEKFYLDQGMFPLSIRDELMPIAKGLASSYVFSSSVIAYCWFLGWIAALLCLLIGYRTRLMSVLSFIFLVVIHLRNPYILNGADTVFRVLSFWILFLPLDRHYTIFKTNAGSFTYSFPLRMIQLQAALIYLMTGIFKQYGVTWKQGTAVYYAMQLDSLLLPSGSWLFQIAPSWLMYFLNYYVLFAELAFLPLVFLPFIQPGAKIIALVLCGLMHLGIFVFMSIPNFALVMIFSYVLFLEERWIITLERKISRFKLVQWLTNSHSENESLTPERHSANRSRQLLITCFLSLAMFIVFASLYDAIINKGSYKRVPTDVSWSALVRVISLNQNWRIFAPNPFWKESWVEVQGLQSDGSKQTIYPVNPREDGPPRRYLGPDMRLKKYESNLLHDHGREALLKGFANYFCRDTRQTHFERIVVLNHYRTSHAPGERRSPIQTTKLFDKYC